MLAFLIATEGIFTGIKISILDVHRLIEIVIFLYFSKTIFHEINNNRFLYISTMFALSLFFLLSVKLFVVTFIYNESETYILSDMVRLFLMFMFFYLIYILLKNRKNSLNLILLFNLPIMLIAFMQFNLFPFSDMVWDFKNTYFQHNTLDVKFDDDAAFRTRVIGLYSYSIPLAYILSVNMIIGLYLFIKTEKPIYVLYLLFLGLITTFTLTRSILLSWIIVMSYIIIRIIKAKKIFLKLILISTLLISTFYLFNLYATYGSSFDRFTGVKDKSATGRIPLALTGAYASITHPFGLSKASYNEIKQEMYIIFHQENVLNFTSHNGIIQLTITYTLFVLFVLFIYMAQLSRILKKSLDKKMYIFSIISLLAYTVNALFHNNFIFIEDYYVMIFLAILAYEYDIQTKKEVLSQNNTDINKGI